MPPLRVFPLLLSTQDGTRRAKSPGRLSFFAGPAPAVCQARPIRGPQVGEANPGLLLRD